VTELGGFKKQHEQDSSGFEACLTENKVGCNTVCYVIMTYRFCAYTRCTVITIMLHTWHQLGAWPFAP